MTMSAAKPVDVLCIYRIKEGKDDEFEQLLENHWSTLDRVGLVTSDRPARWHRGRNKDNAVVYVERFQWKDQRAPDTAHESPEVMEVWEPMGALAEDMEFIHLEPGAEQTDVV